MITEANASGATLRAEIYAGSRHLATWNGGATYFNHADWLGTERARTNSSGSVCEAIASLPFGDGETTLSNSCTPTPTFFTGKERDSESNLDYFTARYYGSSLGRFMTPDWAEKATAVPYANFGNPQSLNLYSYTLNSPVTKTDADGHACIFGITLFGSHFGGPCPADTPAPPPPPPPSPLRADQKARTAFMAPTRPSGRTETVYQIGGIVNAETQGMKDSAAENVPLSTARQEIAEVRINGDQLWGDRVDKYARMQPPLYSGPDFQLSLDAAANAAWNKLNGVSLTGGATNMNMRTTTDTRPFQGMPIYTTAGPYLSPTPNIVINTYGPNID